MKIPPKVFENGNILFLVFANFTKYMRYIQISKLIIRVATQGADIQTRLFNSEMEELGQA